MANCPDHTAPVSGCRFCNPDIKVRDLDYDAPFATDPEISGIKGFGGVTLEGVLEVVKQMIPEGTVEMFPGTKLDCMKLPNRWSRFWMRLLLGWKFEKRKF